MITGCYIECASCREDLPPDRLPLQFLQRPNARRLLFTELAYALFEYEEENPPHIREKVVCDGHYEFQLVLPFPLFRLISETHQVAVLRQPAFPSNSFRFIRREVR